MGVKDLWKILSPVCEKKSLWELQGKFVAIDLSAWICDSQYISPQNNSYLRNLFFRICYLLLLGVKPIVVLEGKAPHVKTKTIRKRINKNNSKGEEEKGATVTRSRLASYQKQCVTLLSYLGIECVKAPGEAEEYCAHLNNAGLVCGVVTQDSDVFLYGAKEVYRNFQLAPHYTCDVYRIERIEEILNLNRIKLVAFSLLVGCDYTDGVNKVGKESAIKYLKSVPDNLIFERFKSWRNESYFTAIEKQKFPTVDTQLEVAIKQKALQDEQFPDFDVINEFLKEQDELKLDFQWQMPKMDHFISIAVQKLMWEEEYAEKKFFPILTRWHLFNNGAPCGLKITKIIKNRNIKGILSYEVQWDKYDDFTTIEDKFLVEKVYPEIVKDYEESKIKPKKKKVKKNIKESNSKKMKSNKITSEVKENLVTIDQFLTKKIDDLTESGRTVDVVEDFGLFNDYSYYEEDDFNLSNIIDNIISRTNSNPAIELLKEKKLIKTTLNED